MEALKRLLASLRKSAGQFRETEPATSGPQLKPEQATEGFSRKGKIIGFGAIVLILLAAGRTCNKSNQKVHLTSVEQKRVEEMQKEIEDRNSLIQSLRNPPETPRPEQPVFDPSALTPAQLQAVLQASGAPGAQTGLGANATAPATYGATTGTGGGTGGGSAKEARTDWVSYRSSQKEPEKAKGSGQPDLVNVSSIERQPMKPEPQKEEETASEKQPVPDELQQSTGDKYFVRKGTLIPCTEQLRINGAFAGNINCLVSVPVYSRTGAHLLIPQYSLLLGRVTKVESTNAERLFVSFTELIMPDGYTFRLEQPQDGLSANGETGLRDKVDRHTARIFGTSLAMAAIGGLAQIGAGGNSGLYTYSPMDQYRAGVTQNIASSSMQILNRRLDDKPTFVIREGARNNVALNVDLRLPAYSAHRMNPDL